ncbi:transcription factor bHLH118 isoform X2 [Ziziphus jujuba]|uniref:Transcription factor bHLH118 isoform X2 n=2 Tax=Ziziphus jujuba TaxID=326968 RepID=A0A6P3ZI75_ZIZJJ|nr:transcription factor bHLH118 isoform X2 [Ziziphus jujuba]KAH7537937.1 hypothetical protein FEM48_Zijuj03G0145900 [Ziziphus jujuba var. spinosa]
MSSPLHQSNELVFQISPNPHKKHKISKDLILGTTPASLDFAVFDDKKKANNDGWWRQRRKPIAAASLENSTTSINNNKKMMKHRDIERLRRQEMATRYASLRSLLPLELIKGKRSISDHIIEAVNYIKLLQNKIKKLGSQRDELKKLSNSATISDHESRSSSTSPPAAAAASRLSVQPFGSGVEIIISSSTSSFPLSRVLDVLLQEGLSIVQCFSTTINDKLHHTIHSDRVNNVETINLPSLEKKLTEAISSS